MHIQCNEQIWHLDSRFAKRIDCGQDIFECSRLVTGQHTNEKLSLGVGCPLQPQVALSSRGQDKGDRVEQNLLDH